MPDDHPLAADLRWPILVLARRMRTQSGDHELSATELSVLGRILREEVLTAGELARAEHMQPPSMTKIVDRLVCAGLLARQPDPTDGRRQLLSLTQAGADRVTTIRDQRTRWLAQRLDELDDDQRAAIQTALPALQELANLP